MGVVKLRKAVRGSSEAIATDRRTYSSQWRKESSFLDTGKMYLSLRRTFRQMALSAADRQR